MGGSEKSAFTLAYTYVYLHKNLYVWSQSRSLKFLPEASHCCEEWAALIHQWGPCVMEQALAFTLDQLGYECCGKSRRRYWQHMLAVVTYVCCCSSHRLPQAMVSHYMLHSTVYNSFLPATLLPQQQRISRAYAHLGSKTIVSHVVTTLPLRSLCNYILQIPPLYICVDQLSFMGSTKFTLFQTVMSLFITLLQLLAPGSTKFTQCWVITASTSARHTFTHSVVQASSTPQVK